MSALYSAPSLIPVWDWPFTPESVGADPSRFRIVRPSPAASQLEAEALAMADVAHALAGLTPESRTRVLAWVRANFGG